MRTEFFLLRSALKVRQVNTKFVFSFLVILFFTSVVMALDAGPKVEAGLRLPAIFSDHMVLQRDLPVPVWGWAAAGEEVAVSIGGQTVRGKAGADGKWRVNFKALKAMDSTELVVKGKEKTITVKDVAVGEVWLASGQSNMACPMAKEEEAAAVPDAGLRCFRVKAARSVDPLEDVEGAWVVCAKGKFPPGVPYFFIRDVRRFTKVPVGVIVSSVGGTRVAEWVDPQYMGEDPELSKYSKRDADTRQKYRESQKNADPNPALPGKAKLPEVHGRLFSAMIAPLQPYAIRGVIWYQGEDDRGNRNYQALFTSLIGGWKKGWGLREFPFLFVQIAPDTGNDPYIRDVQRRVWKSVNHTAMVVTIDGEVGRHPSHKEAPGTRLALAARALAYGDKGAAYSGPAFEKLAIEGEKAIISFGHVGDGLVARDGELIGFTMAGEDRKFAPAQGKIVGDTIVVTSAGVLKPVAVRYGWDSIPKTNLFNKEGLPASPFRTDDWDLSKGK